MARGEVRYRITADATDYERAIHGARKTFDDFASTMLAGAGFGAGFSIGEKAAEALTGALKGVASAAADAVAHLVEHADKLDDTSARTGLSTKALQEWGLAAKLTGTSTEDLGRAASIMEKNIVKGSGAFKDLGLNVKKLRDMAPEKAFEVIADRIKSIPNPTEQAAAAMDVFGKKGIAVLPAIKMGLSESATEAHRLGLVMGEETVKAAAALSDEADKQALAWEGLRNNLASVITDNQDLMDGFRGLTDTIAAASRVVIAHKGALGVLAGEMFFLGRAITESVVGGLRTAIDLLDRFGHGLPIVADIAAKMRTAEYEQRMGMTIRNSPFEPPTGSPLRYPGSGRGGERPAGGSGSTIRPRPEMAGPLRSQITTGLGPGVNLMTAVWAAQNGEFGVQQVKTITIAVEDATKKSFDWSRAMADVAHSFQVMGISADSAMGRIVTGFAAALVAGQSVKQLLKESGGFGGLDTNAKLGVLLQGAGVAGGILSGPGGFKGALGGAASGAAFGSAIAPGIGTIIGGVAGGILGLFGGGGREEERKKREEQERAAAQAAQEAEQRRLQGIQTAVAGLEERAKGFAAMMAKAGEATAEGQAAFGRLGTFAAATFAEIVKNTGDAIGALREIGPTLDILAEAQAKFGFETSGSFAKLMELRGVVVANEDVAESISGLNQLMKGLGDAGLHNQELFNAFGADAAALFAELTGRGVDANQALALMAPTLQQLWEHQQRFGNITDEATLALLRQAEEQGVVGEEMKSVNERILDVLLAIGEALHATIPEGLRRTGQAAHDALGGMADEAKRTAYELSQVRIPSGERGGGDEVRNFATGTYGDMYFPPKPGGHLIRVAEANRGELVNVRPVGFSGGGGGLNTGGMEDQLAGLRADFAMMPMVIARAVRDAVQMAQ